jgi:Ca2+-binding EF-hand superfamily protein
MKTPSLLLPLLVVGCATQNPSLESRFNAADVNGDGLVSRSEATNLMIAQVFALYDTNGDGTVVETEFVAGGGDTAKFRAATKATGGRMSLADAQANPAAIERMAVPFDEADVDRSGAISLEELKAYKALLEAAVR